MAARYATRNAHRHPARGALLLPPATRFRWPRRGSELWHRPTTPPGLNLLRIEEQLSAAHLRLASTYIENLPWSDVVARYDRPHTFFYLDPPYWQTEGYGVEFPIEQYRLMATLLASMKGRAMVSLNDHPDMREIFAAFHVESTDITYTVGGGRAERRELVIMNWKPDDLGQLF